MAQSTTIKNAKALVFTVDSQDICGSISDIEFIIERDVAEFFTACGDWARQTTGKRRWSGTIKAYYSETSGEALDLLMAAFDNDDEIDMVASPTGNSTGNFRWSGTIKLTSMPFTFNPGDAAPIMVAAPFVGQGALDRVVVGA